MSQLRFRNFGNLSFLQSVDKPRFLSRLLQEHSAYFARYGIDVGALTNDDACARRLLEVFTQPDDAMPGALHQALHLLDALADEAGHERILEEAKRCSVDLGAMPDDLCPGDFALAVWFEQPRLVRVCREKTVCQSFQTVLRIPLARRAAPGPRDSEGDDRRITGDPGALVRFPAAHPHLRGLRLRGGDRDSVSRDPWRPVSDRREHHHPDAGTVADRLQAAAA